ncbi:MAG: hypothetical protein ACOC3G_05440 [Phycisphaeraceae bacterium]
MGFVGRLVRGWNQGVKPVAEIVPRAGVGGEAAEGTLLHGHHPLVVTEPPQGMLQQRRGGLGDLARGLTGGLLVAAHDHQPEVPRGDLRHRLGHPLDRSVARHHRRVVVARQHGPVLDREVTPDRRGIGGRVAQHQHVAYGLLLPPHEGVEQRDGVEPAVVTGDETCERRRSGQARVLRLDEFDVDALVVRPHDRHGAVLLRDELGVLREPRPGQAREVAHEHQLGLGGGRLGRGGGLVRDGPRIFGCGASRDALRIAGVHLGDADGSLCVMRCVRVHVVMPGR